MGSGKKAPAPRRKRRTGKTRRCSVGVPFGGISSRPASADHPHFKPPPSQALEALVNLFGEFVLTTDFHGTIRTIWTANQKVLQRGPKSLLGKRLRDIVGVKLCIPFQKTWQRVSQTGIFEQSNIRFICRKETVGSSAGSFRSRIARVRPTCFVCGREI